MRKRDKELRTFQGVYRGLVSLEPKTERSPSQMVDPSPNAPLLIRVVRYPYAETVARGRRRRYRDAAREMTVRNTPRPHPVADVRAARDEPPLGNPVKALSIHPEPLAPPPSVDAWLASREA